MGTDENPCGPANRPRQFFQGQPVVTGSSSRYLSVLLRGDRSRIRLLSHRCEYPGGDCSGSLKSWWRLRAGHQLINARLHPIPREEQVPLEGSGEATAGREKERARKREQEGTSCRARRRGVHRVVFIGERLQSVLETIAGDRRKPVIRLPVPVTVRATSVPGPRPFTGDSRATSARQACCASSRSDVRRFSPEAGPRSIRQCRNVRVSSCR